MTPPGEDRQDGDGVPPEGGKMTVITGKVEEVSFDGSLARAWRHRDGQSQQMRDALHEAMRSLSNSAAETGSRARLVRKEGMPMLQAVHAHCSEKQEQVMGRINQIRRETSRLEKAVEGARSGAVLRARIDYWTLWLRLHRGAVIGIGVALVLILTGLGLWMVNR